MKKIVLALLLVAVMFSVSCNNVRHSLNSNSGYDPKKAYVYGSFKVTKNTSLGFFLVFTRIDKGNPKIHNRKYLMPFSNSNEVSMIDLPPSQYNINGLKIGNLGAIQRKFSSTLFRFHDPLIITLRPGTAYYLGNYEAKAQLSLYISYWRISRLYNSFSRSSSEFNRKYSNFVEARKVNIFPYIVVTATKLAKVSRAAFGHAFD